MKQVLEVLRHQPLVLNDDSRINMSEQGVIACAATFPRKIARPDQLG
jgi:hypothetical protein